MPKHDKHCDMCKQKKSCGIRLELTDLQKSAVEKITKVLAKFSALKDGEAKPNASSTVYNYMYSSMDILLPTICAHYTKE